MPRVCDFFRFVVQFIERARYFLSAKDITKRNIDLWEYLLQSHFLTPAAQIFLVDINTRVYTQTHVILLYCWYGGGRGAIGGGLDGCCGGGFELKKTVS